MVAELKIPITLSEVAFACGTALNKADIVRRIITDSREALMGDLFIALRGERFNGNDHIAEAKAHGAYTLSDERSDADIFVKEVFSALAYIAAYYKSLSKSLVRTLGITGSIGKTTTKNFISSILSGHGKVCATRGNENNRLGVPLTVLSLSPDTEYLVIEAGMNHTGELLDISRTIEPDIAMITNIGTAHIGNFKDREGIASAKLELFSHAKEGASLLIPFGEPILTREPRFQTVATGYEPQADFSITGELNDKGLSGFFYKKSERLFSFSTKISARHLLPSLSFAFAALYKAGIDPRKISALTGRLSDADTRIKVFRTGNITVIDDSYNASRESLVGALNYLKSFGDGLKYALIGDILELGELAGDIHYEIGKIAAGIVDKLLVFGKHSYSLVRGACDSGLAEENITVIEDHSPEGIAEVIHSRLSCGTLLIKGSHATGLYRVCEYL